MPLPSSTRPTPPDRMPGVVVGSLSGIRRAIAVDLEGRVLDVGGFTSGIPLGGLRLGEVVVVSGPDRLGDLQDSVPFDVPFDVAVSVASLTSGSDVAASLGKLFALVRPGGSIIIVEPIRRAGWRGVVASRWWMLIHRARLPMSRRLRPDLDLVSLVRSAGFELASVERITMPTPDPSLRWFVHLTATRPAS